MCVIDYIILPHAARRAIAAAPLLLKQQRSAVFRFSASLAVRVMNIQLFGSDRRKKNLLAAATCTGLHLRLFKCTGASASASGSCSFATSSAFAASSTSRLMISMFAKRVFRSTVTFPFFLPVVPPTAPEAGGCPHLSGLVH